MNFSLTCTSQDDDDDDDDDAVCTLGLAIDDNGVIDDSFVLFLERTLTCCWESAIPLNVGRHTAGSRQESSSLLNSRLICLVFVQQQHMDHAGHTTVAVLLLCRGVLLLLFR